MVGLFALDAAENDARALIPQGGQRVGKIRHDTVIRWEHDDQVGCPKLAAHPVLEDRAACSEWPRFYKDLGVFLASKVASDLASLLTCQNNGRDIEMPSESLAAVEAILDEPMAPTNRHQGFWDEPSEWTESRTTPTGEHQTRDPHCGSFLAWGWISYLSPLRPAEAFPEKYRYYQGRLADVSVLYSLQQSTHRDPLLIDLYIFVWWGSLLFSPIDSSEKNVLYS